MASGISDSSKIKGKALKLPQFTCKNDMVLKR